MVVVDETMRNKDSERFYGFIGGQGPIPTSAIPTIAHKVSLYRVEMKSGSLELPQIHEKLRRGLLKQDMCYVLDAHTTLFVWNGRKTSPVLRAAAAQLAKV